MAGGTDLEYDDEAIQALIRAYIACRVAMDSLADLPQAARRAVEEPVTTLCHVVGPELERASPGFFERGT